MMKISKSIIVEFTPAKKVTIQKLEDDYYQYCVQYRGNGHYFHCAEGVCGYLQGRFRQKNWKTEGWIEALEN